ncbi:hypothetical protein L6164_030267 [Bauhinia variegata]|uniref:Uncharacterized protein n=1 Tax=Bauhinia variegata TaxID=167791 RepID=A0ACB9LC93_BAUVA|nr:hypothetical protein L6164_030267 [Bauhinia variegata]
MLQSKMMSTPNIARQVGDTTYTKIFVGGLAWETKRETLKHYFEQFGEILEAVVITDRNTGKSKGYGFVTFKDPNSAIKACQNPYPVIDGRRANCNIAALGKRKLSANSWTMVPIPIQGPPTYYNQQIPQYTLPYPSYRYPGYPPPQETYAMNYYNVYGGQHLPIRWPPQYVHPFYGLRQFAPPYMKKEQFSDMSTPPLFTVVGLPEEHVSSSPSISSTGQVTRAVATAGMLGSSSEQKSSA